MSEEVHHYGTTGKGMGQKCSDYETVPICQKHHSEIESPSSSQKIVQKKYGISFEEVSKTYFLTRPIITVRPLGDEIHYKELW